MFTILAPHLHYPRTSPGQFFNLIHQFSGFSGRKMAIFGEISKIVLSELCNCLPARGIDKSERHETKQVLPHMPGRPPSSLPESWVRARPSGSVSSRPTHAVKKRGGNPADQRAPPHGERGPSWATRPTRRCSMVVAPVRFASPERLLHERTHCAGAHSQRYDLRQPALQKRCSSGTTRFQLPSFSHT